MGVGAIIGGLGSAIIGGISANKQAKAQAKAADKAAESARLGFDYLRGNENVQQAQQRGLGAAQNIDELMAMGFQPGAIRQGEQAQGQIGALLGLGGDRAAAEEAFGQFRDSTGYNFRLGEGMSAITGSAAARGLLSSGATLRGLNDYGQNMASDEFGRYFGALQDVQQTGLGAFSDRLGQYGAIQGTGLEAAYNVASQGQSAGSQAARIGMRSAETIGNIRRQGTEDIVSGLGAALGGAQRYGVEKGWWG